MEISVSALLLFLHLAFPKLIVDPDKEAQLSAELLLTEGDLVKSFQQPGPCNEVQEEVQVLRYFLQSGQEKNATIVLSPNSLIQYNFPWSSESWIPQRQKIVPQLNCLDQTDPELLSFLKEEFLWPPFQGKYDMEQIAHARSQQPGFENSFSQQGQDMFLDRVIFKSRVRNGFFIEAGADDLIKDSNTLFFELERDWTGILVEPVLWEKRKALQRNAWSVPLCLGLLTHPHFAPFSAKATDGGMAGVVAEDGDDTQRFQCFPLTGLLLAVGNTTVNLLSLDIEGAEIQVLKTLPWEILDIEVVLVETDHLGEVFPGSRHQLHTFFDKHGYEYVATIYVDDVFVRRDLKAKYDADKSVAEEFSNIYSFNPLLEPSMLRKDEL